MTIKVKLLKDSVAPNSVRLCTWELKYPKFIHPQVMTHRQFSRNVQSTRAIPTKKWIKMISDDMVFPSKWGINQRGMEAARYIEDVETKNNLCLAWSSAFDQMLAVIIYLEDIAGEKLHKQIINRLLEPWAHVVAIVSSTFHRNFFKLRCAHNAQPEIQELAIKMRDVYNSSDPTLIPLGEWHLPLILEDEFNEYTNEDLRKISVGRCARVSHLTHDGTRDPAKDIELHDKLCNDGHWSPFEHVATPSTLIGPISGNFAGWAQYRKQFSQECATEFSPPAE